MKNEFDGSWTKSKNLHKSGSKLSIWTRIEPVATIECLEAFAGPGGSLGSAEIGVLRVTG